MTIRALLAVTGLLSLLFAVEIAFGQTVSQSNVSKYGVLLVGLLVITLVVNLVLTWLPPRKGAQDHKEMSWIQVSINFFAAVISTALFVFYFWLTQSHYHPKLPAKPEFFYECWHLATVGFMLPFSITNIFVRYYGNSSQAKLSA